jgi:hypothetical protein
MRTIIKYFSFVLLFLSSINCKTYKNRNPEFDKFKTDVLAKNVDTDRGIIISCFRCSCIDNFMKEFIQQQISIPVYSDTNCFKQNVLQIHYLPQKITDSIYDRNYNAILFKKLSNGNFECRILTTDESKKFGEIGENFFKR